MKTFEYKGKKYTTEMAKPSAAKPAAVSTPAAKSKVVAGTPTVTASTPASKPVSNPTRAAVAYPRVNIMLTDKPAAAAKPAASKAAPRPTDKYTTRAELEMGRPYSNPPPFVGGIRKDTERFVEASRRSKPAAASKAPSSEVKGRAPTVGAEAKAKRARLDNQGRGMAKGGNANFIKGAIKKPGALRASLGAKPGKPIPAGKLDKASKAPGKLGQRARFAEMLRGFRKNKKQDG